MLVCWRLLLPLLANLLRRPHLPPILLTLTREGSREWRRGERPSIKSPSRKTAPIDNRDDKAPNDFSRCLHRYQNRDHYIACLALPARLPLPRGQATSSVTNSVWIWMTSPSPSKSRTQRPTRPKLKRPLSVYDDDNNNRDVIVANGRQARLVASPR